MGGLATWCATGAPKADSACTGEDFSVNATLAQKPAARADSSYALVAERACAMYANMRPDMQPAGEPARAPAAVNHSSARTREFGGLSRAVMHR